jgi:hypothetical protein
MSSRILAIWFICGIVSLVFPGPGKSQSSSGSFLGGKTNTVIIANYQGSDPLPKPNKIVIYDFAVPLDCIAMDDSVSAQMHRRRMMRRGADADYSPVAVARQVQTAFSETLVSTLLKAQVPTEHHADLYAPAPAHSLIVRGEFVAVDEGDRSKRVIIGFGRGASSVQTRVAVLLTTNTQPILLREFYLKSESGKKPGAAVGLGVGSAATVAVGAATGDVGDKKASVAADAARMARQVAKEIANIMAARGWIPPQPPQPQQTQEQPPLPPPSQPLQPQTPQPSLPPPPSSL